MPWLEWHNRNNDLKATAKTPYRLLQPVKALSHGDEDAPNMLIQGDNLEALKALLPYYAGQVKCIYIDPPFNTGAAFDNYDDNIEDTLWLSLMYRCLRHLHELLRDDGCIFVHLDDKQTDNCRVLMDELFGRKNFMGRITVSARSPSAFSTVNPGVFKSAEYILWYAKDRGNFSDAGGRVVRQVDYAYNKWLTNPDDHYENWTWVPIEEAYSEVLPPRSKHPKSIIKHFDKFVVENARRICRTASISDTGAGEDIVKLKRKSAENPGQVFRLERSGDLDDVYILNGEQILFYAKNVREIDGEKQATSLLTNIWTDISWEGISGEGGVKFKKGKKPERLIRRCIELCTDRGDLVLDSFLGSGTTAAVAHKLGRRWIGVEIGEHAETHCQPRLVKVIEGEQGGISKAIGWQGGGGFRFYQLGPKVFDDQGRINPEIKFEHLAAHIWFAETGTARSTRAMKSPLLGVHDGTAYYLLYNGILGDKTLAGGNMLTMKLLAQLPPHDGPKVIYGEGTNMTNDRLRALGITFRKTPNDIRAR